MYKLVAVAGKLRGDEFVLEDGAQVVGRGSDSDVVIDIAGVSKKHFRITVKDDSCFLEDLESSNGTFLNDKLIKSATASDGDKITLPDLILQLVFVKEKKVLIHKETDNEESEDDFGSGGVAPQSIAAKIVWFFKYRFMNFVHGMNEEYEWRHLLAILLTLFCVIAAWLWFWRVF